MSLKRLLDYLQHSYKLTLKTGVQFSPAPLIRLRKIPKRNM